MHRGRNNFWILVLEEGREKCNLFSSPSKEIQISIALLDSWCVVNSDRHEYTYYSHAHNSYLNGLLFSQSLVGNVIDSKIHDIIITDHGPM